MNAALVLLRSRRRRQSEAQIEDLRIQFDELYLQNIECASSASDTAGAIDSRDTLEMVTICIDRPPESYRSVLVLRDVEELDTADVATRLAITPNATKIRLYRARQALKSLVEQERSRAGRLISESDNDHRHND